MRNTIAVTHLRKQNFIGCKSFSCLKMQYPLLLLAMVATLLCNAQKTVAHNNQQWLQYYFQLQLPKKLSWQSDVSIRRINDLQQWSQITVRVGLGYMLPKNFQIATGAACFSFFTDNKPSKIEFRVYQEFNTTQKIKGFFLQHRFRIESRYFRNISNGTITKAASFNFRFRYRVFCTIPLQKVSVNNTNPKFFLNIGDEVFVNAGKEIKYNILDNNRLLLGASIQFQDKVTVLFLYNFQYGQRNIPNLHEHSDIFWMGITHKITVKKSNDKVKYTAL